MNTKSDQKTSKLFRSSDDRVLGGVCSGLGKFFQVDASIVRLIFVLIAIFGGGGILLYMILWLIIPSDSSDSEISKENIEKNVDEMKDKAKSFAKEMKINTANFNSRQLFGVMVLVFGVVLLMGSFGFVNLNHLMKFFPAIIIIIIGVAILKKRD